MRRRAGIRAVPGTPIPSAVLDGAAARALIGAKFIPYSEAGAAIPVTTLMPMNIKASAHCRAA